MSAMKPIPEDTGSFLAIRTANPQMLYVDKTAYLHRLVTSSRKCLFIARPRRFGKSLMITTLKEIFSVARGALLRTRHSPFRRGRRFTI